MSYYPLKRLLQICPTIFFFFFLASLPLFLIEHGSLVRVVNYWANETWDSFFVVFTELGNGLVFGFLILTAIFLRYYYALTLLIAFFFNGLLSFLGKQVLFPGVPRPLAYYEEAAFYHINPELSYHLNHSFPSGHTMTIFALAFLGCAFTENRWVRISSLILALGVGFSRMYLLLHFYRDIYFGALCGFFCCLIALLISDWAFALYRKKLWWRSLVRVVPLPDTI
jgi:membrane-associated phospholipid phosphatase